jgi:hypothetical protein
VKSSTFPVRRSDSSLWGGKGRARAFTQSKVFGVGVRGFPLDSIKVEVSGDVEVFDEEPISSRIGIN